jgi:DNA-binding IclR family transcriptional regulator
MGLTSWEVGHGFALQEPLARLARVPLARLVDRVGESAHLVVLQGSDVLYVIEDRAPGRPPLVTDVGVRLPAHLTASGRAILAGLPAAQVRALYPRRDVFVTRTGAGPSSPTELRRLLASTRARGHATEDGEVTPGFASVAAPVEAGTIHASVAVTWEKRREPDVDALAEAVRATAAAITRRLRHGPAREAGA